MVTAVPANLSTLAAFRLASFDARLARLREGPATAPLSGSCISAQRLDGEEAAAAAATAVTERCACRCLGDGGAGASGKSAPATVRLLHLVNACMGAGIAADAEAAAANRNGAADAPSRSFPLAARGGWRCVAGTAIGFASADAADAPVSAQRDPPFLRRSRPPYSVGGRSEVLMQLPRRRKRRHYVPCRCAQR